jgi:hypothetical protein
LALEKNLRNTGAHLAKSEALPRTAYNTNGSVFLLAKLRAK